MKKTLKRTLAIVMAVAMLFALSVTAFARDDDDIIIEIYINGQEYATTFDVTYVEGMTVYDALDSVSALGVVWQQVADYYVPNHYHYVATSILNYSTGPMSYAPGVQVQAWSSVNPGYGLVSTVVENDVITGYNFVYAGNDWVYEVNYETPGEYVGDYFVQYYMDEAELEAGDTITIYYDLLVSYWYSDYPIQSVYPYI